MGEDEYRGTSARSVCTICIFPPRGRGEGGGGGGRGEGEGGKHVTLYLSRCLFTVTINQLLRITSSLNIPCASVVVLKNYIFYKNSSPLPPFASVFALIRLLTRFLTIFRRFPTIFRRFPKIIKMLTEGHTYIFAHFPKISEYFRGLPRKIRLYLLH